MAEKSVDLFVIGGGINGASVARDAAGRGLRVMLAEKGDFAGATSSATSNLIHGGLRYLQTFEFGLVRQSLTERGRLLRAAPYLVRPLRFLVPVTRDQQRPAWMVHLGLRLYDILGGAKSLAASGRLARADARALPRLRQEELTAVLQYYDCRTDDARLVLALLLDARERGADVAPHREVTAVRAADDGYGIEMRQAGRMERIRARFVVNATGPWANRVNALCDAPPEERSLRLVRGSHLVLKMPEPALSDAFTMQNFDGRVVFALPWLGGRYLLLGTTDVPHAGEPGSAHCSDIERDYLLAVYNRYFAHPGGDATPGDVIATWSGVRPLVDDGSGEPSRITRNAMVVARARGNGGFLTIYGGKLTTHRHLAETVMDELARLGANTGSSWTREAVLPGGHFNLQQLAEHAAAGPKAVPPETRLRWADTYGDRIMALYDRIAHAPRTSQAVAPGVPEAELMHAREAEDAATAEDFLYRRTKLAYLLEESGRAAVERWFARAGS